MIALPASVYDANYVGRFMRQTDVDEMEALGLDPLTIPRQSLDVSDPDLRWSLVDDGLPVGVCGASRYNDDVGVVWLLTADGFGRNPRATMRVTAQLLAAMHARYPVLFNWIDERNVRSLRWLYAAGFFPTATHPNYMGSGLPFTCHVSLRNV
jgi:hypothetical protein